MRRACTSSFRRGDHEHSATLGQTAWLVAHSDGDFRAFDSFHCWGLHLRGVRGEVGLPGGRRSLRLGVDLHLDGLAVGPELGHVARVRGWLLGVVEELVGQLDVGSQRRLEVECSHRVLGQSHELEGVH